MTTVSNLLNDMKVATGRDDSQSQLIMVRGINAGVVAAALMFRPSELRTSKTVSAVTTGNYVSISSLTRWSIIDEVYNTTAGHRVWPLMFPELTVLQMPSSGSVLFWAEYGNNIHYRPIPSATETLTIFYLALPARVSASQDTLPLDTYQDFILSFAQQFVWAGFEEPDSAAIWQKLTETTGMPHSFITQVRDAIQRQAPNVYDVSAARSKSSA